MFQSSHSSCFQDASEHSREAKVKGIVQHFENYASLSCLRHEIDIDERIFQNV